MFGPQKETRPTRTAQQRWLAGAVLALVAAAGAAVTRNCTGATSSWTAPHFDKWFYTEITAGNEATRQLGPTWVGGLELDPATNDFKPRTADNPSRHGMSLVVFNTATQITPDLPLGRYRINSVTFTITNESTTGASILYDDTPDERSELLADFVANQYDSARPIELYGAGLRAGYVGYDFSGSSGDSTLMRESPHPYSGPNDGYIAYPIVGGEAVGSYVDVSNSITGGFSATEADASTDPFDALPWAIGKTTQPPGTVVNDATKFTFELDLDLPGVRYYVQRSIAEGGLGFFVSSVHRAEQEGGGASSYPQWYLREASLFPYDAPDKVPTLTIDYEFLSSSLPGDYDGNHAVEEDDFLLWKKLYGSEVTPFTGADGSGNGFVDAADYTVWRNHLGLELGLGQGFSVPEPSTLVGVMWLAAIFATRRRRGKSARQRDRESRRQGSAQNSQRSGFTLIELLISIAIIGVLLAVLLPAVQAAREASRRIACQNNLKQIGLAVQQYAEANAHLPPPKLGEYQFDGLGGTLVLLLPYLEESNRLAAIDKSKSVEDAVNLPITSRPVDVYLCPSMRLPRLVPEPACGEKLGPGSYLISTRTDYDKFKSLDGAFANPSADHSYSLGFQHITDGTSCTLLVGEINYGHAKRLWGGCAALDGSSKWGDQAWANGYWALAWGHMAAKFPAVYNNSNDYASPLSDRAFRSDHPGGVQFAMLDGSVRMLSTDSAPAVRRALVTRAGGESDHNFD
jgi:prepilin-type N-terminal cleavage/methylation domain-containing protein/prepilin-type processing-associated H-X9-DG protein